MWHRDWVIPGPVYMWRNRPQLRRESVALLSSPSLSRKPAALRKNSSRQVSESFVRWLTIKTEQLATLPANTRLFRGGQRRVLICWVMRTQARYLAQFECEESVRPTYTRALFLLQRWMFFVCFLLWRNDYFLMSHSTANCRCQHLASIEFMRWPLPHFSFSSLFLYYTRARAHSVSFSLC
jgi:hypothetical protein